MNEFVMEAKIKKINYHVDFDEDATGVLLRDLKRERMPPFPICFDGTIDLKEGDIVLIELKPKVTRSKKITFDVQYQAGHSYTEIWGYDSAYCPNCGAKEVWSQRGECDYHVGPTHLCAKCGYSFHLPFTDRLPEDQTEPHHQRYKAIKAFVEKVA